jgi:hypothetical protein
MSTYNFIYANLAAQQAITQVLLQNNKELKQLVKDMKQSDGTNKELDERYQELVGEW